MKWIAWTLLAMSLALNAYLLAHRVAAVTAPPLATPAPPPERKEAPSLPRPAPASPVPRDRADLEQRLADVEQRIEELRTPLDRWKHGQPTPEVEAKVRPYLDKVFAKYGTYTLDCRGGVCRIHSKVSIADWMGDLQTSFPDAARFRYMFADGAYVQPYDGSMGAGMWLWWAITMKARDPVQACLTASTAHGDLTVDLDLDDKARHVAVRIGGSLANDAVGQCVRRAFEDAVAATEVPSDAHAVLGRDIRFTLPLIEAPR